MRKVGVALEFANGKKNLVYKGEGDFKRSQFSKEQGKKSRGEGNSFTQLE